jgi:hypothetical protein
LSAGATMTEKPLGAGQTRCHRPREWRRSPRRPGRRWPPTGRSATCLSAGSSYCPITPTSSRELAGLRYEQGERGLTRIEAGDPGLRDDLADSLALATSPFTRHGRVDCRLARLSRSAIPDADVPAVEDTVTTGGGLVVPRRPFLQSVNGPEVSLPAQLAAPAPPREPDAIERPRTYLQTTRS